MIWIQKYDSILKVAMQGEYHCSHLVGRDLGELSGLVAKP
jgi:hypothetical protein